MVLPLRIALAVAAGGALGSLGRYAVGAWLHRPEFPWGTVVVNAAGSFALGFFMLGLYANGHAGEGWRLAFAIGFVGAFTTMSAFAYESAGMLADGRGLTAALHFLLNPLLSLACAALGMWVGRLVPS